MFGADRRIIEPGGDRVCQRDLAVVVLENIAFCSPEHAYFSIGHETRGMFTEALAAAASLDPDHFYFVVQKRMKKSDRVRASADTGDKSVRKASFFFEHLFTGFLSDNTLKIS